MWPALLTTLLWSYCVIPARQSIAQLGENAANAWRLLTAVVVMGVIVWLGDLQLGRGVFFWFLLSGVIGFGFGDLGVFFALPRIGSRLTLLMAQCLAAPIAGVVEWLWLGTRVSGGQIIAIMVILGGVVVALFPDRRPGAQVHRRYGTGLLFGLLAALGQSVGSVLSRKAFALHEAHGFVVSEAGLRLKLLLGTTAGFERLLGGLGVIILFWSGSRFIAAWRTPADPERIADPLSLKIRNVLLHAATGPVLGIICFQWALATTPSMVVQAIVALTPLTVIPLSYALEGDRPHARAIAGTVLAVVGVIGLGLA